MATIRVRRLTGPFGAARQLDVLIDGMWAGWVLLGDTASFDVEPGVHDVTVKMDWTKSRPLQVACEGPSSLDVDVIMQGTAVRAIVQSLVSPGRVFEVRRRVPELEEAGEATRTSKRLGSMPSTRSRVVSIVAVGFLLAAFIVRIVGGSAAGAAVTALFITSVLLTVAGVLLRRRGWASD